MIRLAQITVVILYLGLLAIIVSGCSDEVYRYPCMNPKNWDQAKCKRPECEILGECPDQLMKPELTKGQTNER
jgi:hypothetical protein